MDWLIVVGIIIAIYLLGKYDIEEGQRVERQKEFEKNLENWDKNGRKEKASRKCSTILRRRRI